MSDIKVWKLENMPLMSNGTVRSIRCNIISFYCPACDMWHTQERKDTYAVDSGDETFMLCQDGYDNWKK